MRRVHVKRGDEVVVIAGSEKGRRGKVISVLPDRNRVLVEGVKMIKRHAKRSQQHPQGAIVEKEGSIHASNVMLASNFDSRRVRVAPK